MRRASLLTDIVSASLDQSERLLAPRNNGGGPSEGTVKVVRGAGGLAVLIGTVTCYQSVSGHSHCLGGDRFRGWVFWSEST